MVQSDEDSHFVPGAGAMKVETSAIQQSFTQAGQVIDYIFKVTNVGLATLSDPTVIDPLVGEIELEASTLVPGQSTTGRASYTVTDDDVEARNVYNSAFATGSTVPPSGSGLAPVSVDSAPSAFDVPLASIAVAKAAYSTEARRTGDWLAPGALIGPRNRVYWTYTVTNTGEAPLREITVVDVGILNLAARQTYPCRGVAARSAAICYLCGGR